MNYGKHAAQSKPSLLRRILELFLLVLGAAIFAWCIRTFVAEPYEIPSGSMENTIMIGDRVVAEKLSLLLDGPKPGEIVTFDSPEVSGRTLIKRCIATEGQTIELKDNGKVFIDGIEQVEPYTDGRPTYPLDPAPGVSISYPYTVPAGYVWVMGDNRTNSADSRYFGPVPVSSVRGHAFVIFWPFNRMHLI